jgi:hypothetical protein
VASLRRAARGHEDICPLLASAIRFNAEREAKQGRLTCTQAALRLGGGSIKPRTQLEQPIAGIIIFAQRTESAGASFSAQRGSANLPGLNVTFVRAGSGRWQIGDVGYEF